MNEFALELRDVRKSFGNNGRFITKEDVAKLRQELATRTTPWTIEELKRTGPQPVVHPAPFLTGLNQARLPHHLEVKRQARLGQV